MKVKLLFAKSFIYLCLNLVEDYYGSSDYNDGKTSSFDCLEEIAQESFFSEQETVL